MFVDVGFDLYEQNVVSPRNYSSLLVAKLHNGIKQSRCHSVFTATVIVDSDIFLHLNFLMKPNSSQALKLI